MALLPDREVCEKLCGRFFSTIFPVVPILDHHGFGDEFSGFWDEKFSEKRQSSPKHAVLRERLDFLCLMSSLLFTALRSMSELQIRDVLGDANVLDAADMYFLVRMSAILSGFPERATTSSLAAYIITQNQVAGPGPISGALGFISTSIRIALGMGLSRNFPETGTATAEKETRQRLWRYIFQLDVMSSASSGLSPLLLNDKMAHATSIRQKLSDGESSIKEGALHFRGLTLQTFANAMSS
jgi:hypothetical protein